MKALVVRAAPLIALGLILTACSGNSSRSGSPRVARPAPVAARRLRCGAAARVGRPLQAAKLSTLDLPGTPDGIATTPDGATSFVALQSGPPRIAVIDNRRSGGRVLRTVVVPRYASGMNVTPDGRYVLGAAGRGALVLDVAAAISGAGGGLLGSLAAPAGVGGTGPGAAEIAVSPDSRYVFVTLEGAGVVAAFDLDAAIKSGFGTRGFLGAIPVGAGALGITVSPDGRWLYEVSESPRAGSPADTGALNVIDVTRAVHEPPRSVIATAPAACAPVRVAVAADGAVVWVTARDGNALLGFSTLALRRDPLHALVSVTRVGEQPLGLAVVDGGRRVLVADSSISRSRGTRAGVSVVNTASSANPTLLGSILGGKLADAISAPATGDLALVTNSGSRQLEAFPLGRLP